MNVLLWIVLGALAGWIASVIMGTSEKQSIFTDILLGVLGAFIGGFIMNLFQQPGVTGLNIYSLIVAVIGAVLLVAIRRAFQQRGRGAY
ncbi:MAG: hypothetical protein A3I29_00890 [Candidatus Magasanikbacteria bacterium RIFCSPLOWO2_02_FULL_44_11]|uniref:Transglycosylase n=2 Tax=Candidatus Magasanikiibacteriota TaxID=1752731 RepID=A0A1F6N9D7_9BACT|nr:MAG: hypothetical protein A3D53_03550 [Candidatus Magasanikbacteria bacterium RIFCSPHIGHO2_02_FULL_45_10]OGH80388.1 MAG: hypothetical protein A3I29_00890 [Candidatus Magasanikbacteria bacterium RIFCSPLOWO2_02_FULL_44_11]